MKHEILLKKYTLCTKECDMPIGSLYKYQAIDETWQPTENTTIFSTFDEFWTFAKSHETVLNLCTSLSLFRKHKQIIANDWDYFKKWTETNFKTVKIVEKTIQFKTTFSWLMDNLKSDEFIEYCKERGLTIIERA